MATREQINFLYQQYLGRDAEKAGLDYWLGSIERGATLADVEYNIANSQEAQSYAVQQQLDETDIFSDTTTTVTADDEKIAQALNLLLAEHTACKHRRSLSIAAHSDMISWQFDST